jgi:hypothetical protein
MFLLQLLQSVIQIATKESLMSFVSALKSFGQKVHDFVVKLFGQSAIDNVDAQLKAVLKEDVLVIFKDAVAYAQTLPVGGADKRQAAFNQIVADLKSKGTELGTSTINLGIELVLGLLKGKSA